MPHLVLSYYNLIISNKRNARSLSWGTALVCSFLTLLSPQIQAQLPKTSETNVLFSPVSPTKEKQTHRKASLAEELYNSPVTDREAVNYILEDWAAQSLSPKSRPLKGTPAPSSPSVEKAIRTIYAKIKEPLWFDEHANESMNFYDLEEGISSLKLQGLNPENYPLRDSKSTAFTTAGELAQKEWKITQVTLEALNDLRRGRYRPKDYDYTKSSNLPLADLFLQHKKSENIGEWLTQQSPQIPLYKASQKEFAALLNAQKETFSPPIPSSESELLKRGYKGDSASILRQKLQKRGFIKKSHRRITSLEETQESISKQDKGSYFSSSFDSELEKALIAFQTKNEISPTGFVDPQTLVLLNDSPSQRRHKLQVNMERLRWFSDMDKEPKRIFVNMATQTLNAYQGNQKLFDMDVIVGREDRQTPLMKDRISSVIWRPNWTPTLNILRKDVIPKASKNLSYLKKKGFTVYYRGKKISHKSINWEKAKKGAYIFVQQSSKKSSLGSIRFSLTNDQAIYLHDTPAKSLFKEQERLFSSGCVRVSDPAKLATYLLEDNRSSWPLERVQSRMTSGTRAKPMPIRRSTPVYLAYLTTEITENGDLSFLPDPYDLDTTLAQEMGLTQ